MKKLKNILKRVAPFCAVALLLFTFVVPASADSVDFPYVEDFEHGIFGYRISGQWEFVGWPATGEFGAVYIGMDPAHATIDGKPATVDSDSFIVAMFNEKRFGVLNDALEYDTVDVAVGSVFDFSSGFGWLQSPEDFASFLVLFRQVPPAEGSALTDIFSVFSGIGTWIVGAVAIVGPMFFANGELTFLGTLAVAALAFAVVFLLIAVIRRFLNFKG